MTYALTDSRDQQDKPSSPISTITARAVVAHARLETGNAHEGLTPSPLNPSLRLFYTRVKTSITVIAHLTTHIFNSCMTNNHLPAHETS